MLNVDDPDEAPRSSNACAKMGLVGSFIPVSPQPDKPYSNPIYDRFWAMAQELKHPLLLHIGTPRDGVPANEFTMDLTELTGAGPLDDRLLGALLAGLDAVRRRVRQVPGAEDRLGRARGGVDPALAEADGLHLSASGRSSPRAGSRPRGCCRATTGSATCSSSSWRTISASQLRDRIGVENMLWGSDYPHAEATFPRSQQFLAAHVRRRARGRSAQDHLGERRQDVRLHAELTLARDVSSSPLPHRGRGWPRAKPAAG